MSIVNIGFEKGSKFHTFTMETTIFLKFVSTITDPSIVLLRQRTVVQWLFGDRSFLEQIRYNGDKLKDIEDGWGREILKKRRMDLDLDKQWTGKFGEHICEELYLLLGKSTSSPHAKHGYKPDLETDDAVLEVKTQTFYTTGTAGEKILGCPFKYSEVPDLWGKPLKIICLGGAEDICRRQYGNLPGEKCSPQKKKFLDFFRENRIEYIGASDILRSFSLLLEPHSSGNPGPLS